MKIAGIELSGPTNIIIPIIRGEEEIIFQAHCISNMDELDKVMPEPQPGSIKHRGQAQSVPNIEDPKYIAAIEEYGTNRVDWMVAKSLLATEGLEWDTVDFTNPQTFKFYKVELKMAGFNEFQIMQLVKGVLEANGLNEERIEEAKKRFLAGELAEPDKQSFPTDEQPST